MERTNRAVTNRKNKVNARNARGMYVDGNTVRRLQGSAGTQIARLPVSASQAK